MNVYEVYKPIIYNDFFKEERKKRNLTLQDLSKQIHYSLGLLSQLENDTDLLNNGKTSILLIFYGYDIEYLIRFNKELNNFIKRFINALLYMDKSEVKKSYDNLSNFFYPYQDSVLYTIFIDCQFIYNVFFYNYRFAEHFIPSLSSAQYYSDYFLVCLEAGWFNSLSCHYIHYCL